MTVRALHGFYEPPPPYRGFERRCECGKVMRQRDYEPEALYCRSCGRGWSATESAWDKARASGEIYWVQDA